MRGGGAQVNISFPLLTGKTKLWLSASQNHQESALTTKNKAMKTTTWVNSCNHRATVFKNEYTCSRRQKSDKFHDPGDVSFLVLLTVDFCYLNL